MAGTRGASGRVRRSGPARGARGANSRRATRVCAARRVRRAVRRHRHRARPLRSGRPAARQPRPPARAHSPEPDRDLGRQRRVVDAFFAASRDGDFDALLEVLDPDVELRIDGGMLRADASLVLRGADAVAAHTTTYSTLHPFVRPALVNGAAGAVVAPRGRLFCVMGFTVSGGRITAIDALIDPERLAQLGLDLRAG